MKFTSLYKLSEQDKEEMIRKILPEKPPEDVMTVNKIIWTEFIKYLNWQGDVIQNLRDGMAFSLNEIFELKKIVENQETGRKNNRNDYSPIVNSGKIVREIPDDWEDIIESVNDGSYREKYRIGNYKPVDLGREGIIRMQIAGFDTEPLADSSGRAAITWVAMELLNGKNRMKANYKTGAVGGWKESDMRKYLSRIVRPSMPGILGKSIKPVIKFTYSYKEGNQSVNNENTVDELWIPSLREVYGIYEDRESCASFYSSIFADNTDRVKKSAWWLRSAAYIDSYRFVTSNGMNDYCNSNEMCGIALSFCT